jgi:membrane protein YqaA with SNARE-associated domain
LQRYGYGAAFAAVMVEGMGIPTPGQTLLMAGALEAAEGRMSIALLLILVTTAATVGNSIGYAIGRWGGRRALNKLNVNPQRQQRLDDLFKRRGGVVILLARFLDGLRQLNGIVAGVLQIRGGLSRRVTSPVRSCGRAAGVSVPITWVATSISLRPFPVPPASLCWRSRSLPCW